MAVQPVLRLGDPRLRVRSAELEAADFGGSKLMALVEDLRDTMAAAAGAGLAAPQIGVPLRVVLYGMDANPRYPDAPPIAETLLVNPVITPHRRRVRGGLGGVSERAGSAGSGDTLANDSDRLTNDRRGSAGATRERLSCAGGAARMRSPRWCAFPRST